MNFTRKLQGKRIYHFTSNFTVDWVAQTSIKFKSQLNLKCKLISCTFQVNLRDN